MSVYDVLQIDMQISDSVVSEVSKCRISMLFRRWGLALAMVWLARLTLHLVAAVG